MRAAPGQSYVNPVERVMSVLNMAIQGIATARAECTPPVEKVLKGAQSIKTMRAALAKPATHVAGAAKSPTEEWGEAMQVPVDQLAGSLRVQLSNALYAQLN